MMSGGLKYAIELIDKNFGVGIKKAKEETKGLDKAVNTTNADIKKLGSEGKGQMGGLGSAIKGVGIAMAALQIANYAIDAGKALIEVTDKSEKLKTSLALNSGQEGGKNLEYITQRSKELNVDLEASKTGFENMSKSMQGTNIQGKGLRDIYDGVGVASAVMKSNGKATEAMLDSFGNVAQKRLVTFDDFKSQFADKIPGAMHIASKAMGVSENKLKTMMDNGKVNADKFLPLFAKQIKTTFEEVLPAAANSMQAAMNKKANAITGFQEKASALFGPGLKDIVNGGAVFVDWLSGLLPYFVPIKEGFTAIIIALSPIFDALKNVVSQFGSVEGNAGTLGTVLQGIATVVEIFASGIGFLIDLVAPLIPYIVGLEVATWALNLALTANPIGVVVMSIVAFIGAIVYAYNKIGWFRGAIMATWEAIKGFAKGIKDYVINNIKEMLNGIVGIGKALYLFFKGDWEGAWKTGKQAAGNLMGLDAKKKLIDDLKQVGKKSGEAYHKGVNEVAAAKLKNKTDAKAKATVDGKSLENISGKLKSDNSIVAGTDKKKVAGSGGGREGDKHITFNIASFVKEMTISTNALGMNPGEIKKQMQSIFNEIVADLEVRVNA